MLRIILIATVISVSSGNFDPNACDIPKKVEKYLCKAAGNIYKADDGKLAQHLCGCIASFFVAKPSLCPDDDYDYKDAPVCGQLIKSEDFRTATKTFNPVTKRVYKIMYKQMFNLCEEKDKNTLVKYFESTLVPGPTVNFLAAELEGNFPFIPCYLELLNLTKQADYHYCF